MGLWVDVLCCGRESLGIVVVGVGGGFSPAKFSAGDAAAARETLLGLGGGGGGGDGGCGGGGGSCRC